MAFVLRGRVEIRGLQDISLAFFLSPSSSSLQTTNLCFMFHLNLTPGCGVMILFLSLSSCFCGDVSDGDVSDRRLVVDPQCVCSCDLCRSRQLMTLYKSQPTGFCCLLLRLVVSCAFVSCCCCSLNRLWAYIVDSLQDHRHCFDDIYLWSTLGEIDSL